MKTTPEPTVLFLARFKVSPEHCRGYLRQQSRSCPSGNGNRAARRQGNPPDFRHITQWEHPRNYAGDTWEGYYSAGFGQSRDSKVNERADFLAVTRALQAIPEPANWQHDSAPFTIVRESHWVVGWVEWIAIHLDAKKHLAAVDKINASFEDYPVVDEDLLSEMESDEANETWRDCYDDKQRLAYVRSHRSQFDFSDFRDLIGCIRGRFFSGYASELIYS